MSVDVNGLVVDGAQKYATEYLTYQIKKSFPFVDDVLSRAVTSFGKKAVNLGPRKSIFGTGLIVTSLLFSASDLGQGKRDDVQRFVPQGNFGQLPARPVMPPDPKNFSRPAHPAAPSSAAAGTPKGKPKQVSKRGQISRPNLLENLDKLLPRTSFGSSVNSEGGDC
ncbi:hypothetical protein ABID16_001256 [Rhizobium aquaticum]|uniref:Uncharacterized protein n=1 Tax=Rhizobium aquaticum TaxID=1549636 RepID=A0ABV2IWT9_9HYPH